jgi:flavin reductase (DIM6/NTAB) family NADH-FMN oxidoreductase RutF
VTRSSELQFDRTELRRALGLFATGVTVVSAAGEGSPRGMTANAFMSGSLDPPLVLVSICNGAHLQVTIEEAGAFGVAILPRALESEARRFAGLAVDGLGPPRFVEHAGVPVVDGAIAWFATTVANRVALGDHTLFVGEVHALGIARPHEPPLTFFRSAFAGVLVDEDERTPIDPWGWAAGVDDVWG